MTNDVSSTIRIKLALLLAVSVAPITSGACLRQRDRGVVSSTPPGETAKPSRSAPDLTEIAGRVAKKYGDERYISFKAHVENHESILPGWTVKHGGGIAPGSVFDVVMSAAGDIRAELLVDDHPIYEWQLAVQPEGSEDKRASNQYLFREYDHLNKIRAEDGLVQDRPGSPPLAGEALQHPAWCASGGFSITFVGPSGRVADLGNDDAFAYRIAHGSFVRHERLPDGSEVDVIKFVQQEAAEARQGAEGQTIEAHPAIWWYTYVDRQESLVVQEDGYFEQVGKSPVLVRRKRFTDIQFPSHVNEETVFRSKPEAARSYRVWKPGEPYPVGQPHADRTSDGVEK